RLRRSRPCPPGVGQGREKSPVALGHAREKTAPGLGHGREKRQTRLIAFRRPSGTDRDVTATPTSFDLLGFTHFWTRSLRGSWVIKRKTARDRFSRALRAIAQWCQQHRHAPLSWQHAVLSRKLRGHYSYYGITGNSAVITRFRYEVRNRWRKWLDRRGGRSPMSWPHFHRLEERYQLPAAIAVHSSYRRAANP